MAAIACAAVIVVLVGRDRRGLAAVVVVVAVAGISAWRADLPHGEGQVPSIGQRMRATVVSAPAHTGQRQHFVLAVPAAGSGDASRICVSAVPFPMVRMGDEVEVRASVSAALDAPGGIRSALSARGCEASAFASSLSIVGYSPSAARWLAETRWRIGVVLRGAAPGDAGVLLSGLVTGDDEGFSPARVSAFRMTNTTHLTAVSGANLALVAGMMATLGAVTVGRHRLAWQATTIVAVWSYAAISGAQPPAVRAAVVATAAVLAFRFGRRADFTTLILLAAGVMVLVEPRQIDMLGFRLSVVASLALAVAFSGLVSDDRTAIGVDVIAATTAAQLATLPLLLPVFGTVSLISLPANAVVAPLAALTMPIAAVAGLAGLAWAPLGEIVAAPAALLATVILGVIDLMAMAPGYWVVGTPPIAATLVIALAVVAILGAMSADIGRFWARVGRSFRTPIAMAPTALGERRSRSAAAAKSSAPPLAVLAWEDPANALRTDANDAKEEPPGEEYGHELSDVGERRQSIPRNVVGHAPLELAGGDGDYDSNQDQRADEHLPPPAHERDIVAAEEVEPLEPRRFGS